MAGIERAAKTNANGKTLKEAQAINTSLLSLSRCLDTLMINQNQKNKYKINLKLFKYFLQIFLI